MFKSASEFIDSLYKFAQEYLADITCENCGYEGKPRVDGHCPKCGAMEGIKPKDSVVTVEEYNHSGSTGIDNVPAHNLSTTDVSDYY